nr:uncharacterized protein LOC118680777 [Bactrocera oleae]
MTHDRDVPPVPLVKCQCKIHHMGKHQHNHQGPTFIFPSSEIFSGWEEVLDLSLSTETDSLIVDDWRMSMEPSMSNYSWILLSEKSNTPFQYQNPRKTAWDKFNKIATKTLKVNSFMNKITYLKTKVGAWTSSAGESFEELLKTHFSGSQQPAVEIQPDMRANAADRSDHIVSKKKVIYAIQGQYSTTCMLHPKKLGKSQSGVPPLTRPKNT